MAFPEFSLVDINTQLSRLKESLHTRDLALLVQYIENNALLFNVNVSTRQTPLSISDLELDKLRKSAQIKSGLIGVLGVPRPLSNDVLGQSNMVGSTLRFTQGGLFVAEPTGVWIPRGRFHEDIDIPVNLLFI